jgi:hypothetical protein
LSKCTDNSVMRKFKNAMRLSALCHADSPHLPERHEILGTAHALLAGGHVADDGPRSPHTDHAGGDHESLLQDAYGEGPEGSGGSY